MKDRKRIVLLLAFLCILFVSLIIYVNVYFFIEADAYKNLSYNRRSTIVENIIKRGNIIDRNGEILAYSEKNGDEFVRKYNYPKTYSHIVGYSNKEYGKYGLESEYNQTLLGLTGISRIDDLIKTFENKEGNSLRLTIDNDLQVSAREMLIEKRGSIIAMNVKNGEILAMASYPDFSSMELVENWKDIIAREDSPLLNRSTQGLYEPGSIFKIITSNALLGKIDADEKYNSTGSEKVDGYIFKDADREGYGEIDLYSAFRYSSNSYFTNRAQKITGKDLGESAEQFFINKKIEFDLPTKVSNFNYDKLSKVELSASSIGQGKILVTPINMLVMTQLVANKGEYVKPRLVKSVIYPSGEEYFANPEKNKTSLDKDKMKIITDMMVDVVKNGTGKRAQLSDIIVAGKTGTAENGRGGAHAWFVGFAPAEDPEVAVCVLIEDASSSGGVVAAPIGREIIRKALNIN